MMTSSASSIRADHGDTKALGCVSRVISGPGFKSSAAETEIMNSEEGRRFVFSLCET